MFQRTKNQQQISLRRQSKICCVRVQNALKNESVGRSVPNTFGFLIIFKCPTTRVGKFSTSFFIKINDVCLRVIALGTLHFQIYFHPLRFNNSIHKLFEKSKQSKYQRREIFTSPILFEVKYFSSRRVG